MPLDQETITQQLDLLTGARSENLLAAYRRTLSVYLCQQAELGVLAPPWVVNGVEAARAQRATR